MTIGTMLLQLATLGWGGLCGATVYEHLAVIPQWAKQPPSSLSMWVGEHRLKAERFWMAIHPMLLVLLGAALATGWADVDRRTMLFVVLGGYALIIATTAAWYVPELMRLTRDPGAPIPPDEWRTRAKRWEALSLVRGALVIGLAAPLLHALTKA